MDYGRYPHALPGTEVMMEGSNKRKVQIRCSHCGCSDRWVFTCDLFQVNKCHACSKLKRTKVVKKSKPKKSHYVDSSELEQHWANWLDHRDHGSWDALSCGVYKICQGVARNFRPRDEEEHCELAQDAFSATITKINNGKLTFEPGRAPVFNLLTTAIRYHLLNVKNRDKRRRDHLAKYRERLLSRR